jgi:hypothetical protein
MARFWGRDLPPSRSSDEFTSDQEPPIGRNWLPLVLYFIGAMIVALILVLGARAIYHSAHKKKSGNTTSTSQSSAPQTQQHAPNSGQPKSSNQQNTKNNPPATPNSLPNNGPGNVIALFIGTSLAAAGLHYVITVRRTVEN